MPTITFDESWDSRPVGVSARSGRKLVRMGYGHTDDPANTTGVDVIEALAMFIGDPHPEWPAALLTYIGADPDPEDPASWILRLTYEEPRPVPGTLPGSPTGGGGGGGPGSTPPEPADRPPLITVGGRKEQRFKRFDRDNKAYVNAADDPLEDVPPIYTAVGVITVTAWFDEYDYFLGQSYMNKVNSDEWNGFVADTLLIDDVRAGPKTERGRVLWEVVFTILANPLEKWIPTKLLNAGRREVITVAGSPVKVPILDQYGRESPGLTLLDATGARTATPNHIDFRNYDRISFAGVPGGA